MSSRLKIFDTTLRDGEQAPGFSMTVSQKLQMARQCQAAQKRDRKAGHHGRSRCS